MSNNYFDEEQFNETWNGSILLRTARLSLEHWHLVLGFVVGISAVSILEAYLTYVVKRIIDEGVIAGDIAALNALSLQYALIWIPFAFFVVLFILSAGFLGHNVALSLRTRMFDKMQELELAYYNRTPTGWLQARATSDAGRVADLVSWGFLDMLWAVVNISASLIFMAIINVQMMLIVALIIPVLVVIAVYFKRLILKEYRISRRINSTITSAISEGIAGVRVIKALGRERRNLDVFQEKTDGMFEASFKAAWLSKLFLPFVQLVGTSAIAAIVWVGGYQVSDGTMTIGGIQAFVGYVTFMLWPIQQLASVYASMQQAIASAERIFSLLDTEPQIVDAADALTVPSLVGEIVFDDVTFAYENGETVLDNFNLRVAPGETIALVGPTGAGKSTIVNLVARFFEPTSGTITMAGHDYTDLTLHTIQSRLGMVLQTPHLFSGTIMDNIRYGDLDATDEEAITAAKIAGAHSFISELENGYETEVGEGGVLLSVGQKQLLSIGRAILANPDIFIMDEATSSVDTLTEALIQKGMERVLEGRTSFVIAHRLSTIRSADRILVIDDGKIAEIGSHSELIGRRGHYYSLYTKQFEEKAVERSWEMALNGV